MFQYEALLQRIQQKEYEETGGDMATYAQTKIEAIDKKVKWMQTKKKYMLDGLFEPACSYTPIRTFKANDIVEHCLMIIEIDKIADLEEDINLLNVRSFEKLRNYLAYLALLEVDYRLGKMKRKLQKGKVMTSG